VIACKLSRYFTLILVFRGKGDKMTDVVFLISHFSFLISTVFSEFKTIVRQNVPLAMHTWMQLGGPAEYFAEPRSTEELICLLHIARKENLPVRTLGTGSNLLVPDEGVVGLVLRLIAPEFIEIRSEGNHVFAGSGAKLGRVITHSVHAGLGGIEGLIGIPGTVGGALVANAGTNNDDIGQAVKSVKILTEVGEVRELSHNEISFEYRHSSLEETIILSATLQLQEEDPLELSRRLQKLWIFRKTSQPMGHQCTGLVFKNPRGMIAGEQIEKAGLKGTRIGGAVISERNANFIVVEAECTSNDVLRLIELVQMQVHKRLDIELEIGLEIWK